MITRAQAEALLTLAESLEACEHLGVTVEKSHNGVGIYWGSQRKGDLTGEVIREVVSHFLAFSSEE